MVQLHISPANLASTETGILYYGVFAVPAPQYPPRYNLPECLKFAIRCAPWTAPTAAPSPSRWKMNAPPNSAAILPTP
ncbi:hypothetical protein SBA3_2230010 [Candidatus Sulfopaludibacter sp. SbA3]|nr:hypothetical protein SBA3_2230010 [Candidatus Sulfopaludibacter sp. SbA3]